MMVLLRAWHRHARAVGTFFVDIVRSKEVQIQNSLA